MKKLLLTGLGIITFVIFLFIMYKQNKRLVIQEKEIKTIKDDINNINQIKMGDDYGSLEPSLINDKVSEIESRLEDVESKNEDLESDLEDINSKINDY
ncbi:hypothetical protein [Chryseobacterium sp.]|uniref:hypothetical protein n=1 Tax=Chryseobacterium sp. TaxID=1871047 RepID=UPI0028A2B79E|nr:hypothetical protein [Chryseobacterium sp.]